MEITFLGTGTSNGVPIIGCKCPVCTSDNPKNKRYRCAISIKNQNGTVIIDTPQEFRLQCIRENINHIDGVLYTHDHADHISGLDDLRGFSLITKSPIPVFANSETANTIKTNYYYIFNNKNIKTPVPKINLNTISGPINLIGETFIPIDIKHGSKEVLAYKFHNCLYCTDCNYIPKHSRHFFNNLDVLIIDTLRFASNVSHFNFRQALEIIKIYKPKKAYLTHITHYLDYDEVMELLPDNVYMAYDGLKVTV